MTLVLLDLLLAAGLTMRLTRLITTDHLGRWWIQDPVDYRLRRAKHRKQWEALWEYVAALIECPFCIGFWLAGGVLLSLALCGGPGDGLWEPWRWVAGWFTLNYVAAHIGSRIDTTED